MDNSSYRYPPNATKYDFMRYGRKKSSKMIEYLQSQERYKTWFQRNVRINHLNISSENGLRDACYTLIEDPFIYGEIDALFIAPFVKEHKGFEMQFEGHNGGHLVLKHGSDEYEGDYSKWDHIDIEWLYMAVIDFNETVDKIVTFFIETAKQMKIEEEAGNV